MVDLLNFAQQPLETGKRLPLSSRYPVTIIWPAGVDIAVGTHWYRLEDGRIKAIYYSREELEWALRITRWIREDEEPAQLDLFGNCTDTVKEV